MRSVVTVALTTFLVVACSTSGEDDDCPIVGTYSVVSNHLSGDCPDLSDGAPTTYTISARGNGFALAIQGVGGECSAETVGTCKVQGRCEGLAVEPLNPANSRTTLQFSWTFSDTGFRGTTSISVPPIKSLPSGCKGEFADGGTRK